MSPALIGILGSLVFFIIIIFRMPIAYAFILASLLGISFINSPSVAFSVISKDIWSNFSSYSLSVIPLFILMGYFAYYSGIGTRAFRFAYKLMGHVGGGLAIATQFACAFFGAVTGSAMATTVTIGAVSLPEMKKYRFLILFHSCCSFRRSTRCTNTTSIPLLLYGVSTGQSISRLFLAGLVPGIFLLLVHIITILILYFYNPKIAPAGEKASLNEKLSALRDGGLFEIGIVFTLALVGLFAGWFTPTESGSVGAAGILIITVLKRQMNWDSFKKSILDSVRMSAMVIFLVTGAVIFGHFLALSRIPFEIANWVGLLSVAPFVLLLVLMLIYIILGCFIDGLALILLTIPIFYPLVVESLGYDPIWFGVITSAWAGIGTITPPVAMAAFVVKV